MFRKQIVVLLILFSFTSAQANGFFHDLGKTFTDAFDTQGLIILGVGSVATALAFSQDQAMYNAWTNHQRMSTDVSHIGDVWGMGYGQAAIAGAQLIWDRDNGLAHTNALITSSSATFVLKYATARPRPDSDTRTSFPSGHTQAAFVTATSLSSSYGLKVGIPFYTLGVFTALTRLSDNAHWFSDIVAGATIGILFGRSAAKRNMIVSPVSVNRGYGLQLTYFF